MKKRVLKTLCNKALAVTVGAAMMMQAYGPTIASAAEDTQYISEVYLSYGKDDASAKKWLEDNGYTVVDQNLNENAEGGGAVLSFLKIGSEKRSVYLGYQTTTNSDEAITDMRVMNMNGEYSYEAYEKLLEDKKLEINAFIDNVKTALKEYRENYKAKKLVDKIDDLRESLKAYTDCEVKADSDYTKVAEYFKTHTDESEAVWGKAGAVYLILSEIKFGDTTFADIVKGGKFDFSKVDDRMNFYPVIDAMSQGQRSLLSYADLAK